MRIDFLQKMGMNEQSLSGKVAVVTGAGRGIGRELARALAWMGAKVVIAEIDSATGVATEQLIQGEGGESLFVQTDVANERSVASLKEQAIAAYGKVDILVNNALVTAFGSILELPLEAWDLTHRVNLRGAVIGVKTFLPEMLEHKEGTVRLQDCPEVVILLACHRAGGGLRRVGVHLRPGDGGHPRLSGES